MRSRDCSLALLIVAPLLPGSAHQHRVSHAMGSASSADVEPTLQASIIEEPPLALVPPPPTTAVTLQVPELPQLAPPQDLLESLAEKSRLIQVLMLPAVLHCLTATWVRSTLGLSGPG